ncbi:uncharacterized protein LOC142173241 isoform X1 [Nicotiana tabacum]|uniref:Uncharacterized protein LOC142173241 isoform X1 n=1 Tax=Nicotiana tabacum TaxID=4097 RepID=A0AC58TA55_TOBAC
MLTQILFPSTPMKTSEEHHHSTTVSGIRSIIAGTDKQVCKNTNKSMRFESIEVGKLRKKHTSWLNWSKSRSKYSLPAPTSVSYLYTETSRYLVPAQVDRDFCCWTAIRRLNVDLSAFTDLEVPVYLFYSTISFIQTIIFLLGYYL